MKSQRPHECPRSFSQTGKICFLHSSPLQAPPADSEVYSRDPGGRYVDPGIPSTSLALRMDWGREAKLQSEAVQAVASVSTASAGLRGGCLLIEDVVLGELLTALEETRSHGEFCDAPGEAVSVEGSGHGPTAMDIDDSDSVDKTSGTDSGGLLLKRKQVIVKAMHIISCYLLHLIYTCFLHSRRSFVYIFIYH